jgi:CheY-like chemotaxis protein
MKILIVDDESLIRTTTSLLLKQKGYSAICAKNGQEGLELASTEKPDLILLDIMMPGMDGWEVLSRLKTDPEISSIPVVVFTAIDFVASEKTAHERGAQGVLRKPFHLHQLTSILETFGRKQDV